MSILIKIDRNSIKKNKNAGSCTSHVFGVQEVTFKTECTKKEFEELKKVKEIIVSIWTTQNNGIVKITGNLLDIGLMPALPGKWEIDSTNNIETINHFPIPEYSYRHENAPIECEDCKNLIPFRQIQTVYSEDGDNKYEVCPMCNGFDTFEYEFESIDDALKPGL